MKFYAQFGADYIVHTIQQAPSLTIPNAIEVPTYDESLIGKRWTGTKFEPVE